MPVTPTGQLAGRLAARARWGRTRHGAVAPVAGAVVGQF